MDFYPIGTVFSKTNVDLFGYAKVRCFHFQVVDAFGLRSCVFPAYCRREHDRTCLKISEAVS